MRKKKWVAPFLEGEDHYLVKEMKEISTDKPLILEIGMGMGDFITESAKNHPEFFYLGLERDETCVARAIKKAQSEGIENFRVYLTDAALCEELFEEDSIDGIYLQFSDPWPKKHYHKRRLTYPTFLRLYSKILKKDAFLVYKTDNEPFFDDSMEYFKDSCFEQVEYTRNYHEIERNEPMTAYERRFVSLGQPIFFAKYLNRK